MFVADLSHPALGEEDRHHLARVLRLRPGEEVTAGDGAGGWRPCQYRSAGVLEPVGDIEVVPRAVPLVTVAFALTKGERPEWTVQKLAEAGVDRIVPMTTARTVVRWDAERSSHQVARLRSVALAAAMQSRQAWLPTVSDVQRFAVIAAGAPAEAGPGGVGGPSEVGGLSAVGAVGGPGGGVALAQMGGDPPSLARPTILVGPEGGWDEAERGSGLALVTLGPSVLRAETAAMAAGLLLCGLRAGVVNPA